MELDGPFWVFVPGTRWGCRAGGAMNMLVSVYLAGLVAMVGGKRRLGTAMDDDSIKTAAEAWVVTRRRRRGRTVIYRHGYVSSDINGVVFDNTDFNEDISAWDISAVTSMEGMFYYAHAFEHTSVGAWKPASN